VEGSLRLGSQGCLLRARRRRDLLAPTTSEVS
jgi:hypothetical protein